MHPINKKHFGSTGLAAKFFDGSTLVTGYIIKQVGWKRFRVCKSDGSGSKDCLLAQTTDELTALNAGTGPQAAKRGSLCTIECEVFSGGTENIRLLASTKFTTVQGSTGKHRLGYTATKTGEGTIILHGASGGEEGDRPTWLHADAVTGINFQTGEAWINDTLITDLSTVFTGYSAGRQSAAGYDQSDGVGALRASGALFNAIKNIDWAVRAEFDIDTVAGNPCIMMAYGEESAEGFEILSEAGEFKATSYYGFYTAAATATVGQHVLVASNNVAGWTTSVDGADAVVDGVQSTAFNPDVITFGVDSASGSLVDPLVGTLIKYEFFPLLSAAQVKALSA